MSAAKVDSYKHLGFLTRKLVRAWIARLLKRKPWLLARLASGDIPD